MKLLHKNRLNLLIKGIYSENDKKKFFDKVTAILVLISGILLDYLSIGKMKSLILYLVLRLKTVDKKYRSVNKKLFNATYTLGRLLRILKKILELRIGLKNVSKALITLRWILYS